MVRFPIVCAEIDGRCPTVIAATLMACVMLGPASQAGKAQILTAPHVDDTSNHVRVIDVRRRISADQYDVMLEIDPGFHINANPASFEYLIPTTLTFAGVLPTQIAYPLSVQFKPKFADAPLDVYQGTVTIAAFFSKGTLGQTPDLRTSVTAQACTDSICLPPADLPVIENWGSR
jgi:hypothetical protein